MNISEGDKAIIGSVFAFLAATVSGIGSLLSRRNAQDFREGTEVYSRTVSEAIDAAKQAMTETQANIARLIARL